MGWTSLGELLGVFSGIPLGPVCVLIIVMLVCITHVIIKCLDVHQNIKIAELNSSQKRHKQKTARASNPRGWFEVLN